MIGLLTLVRWVTAWTRTRSYRVAATTRKNTAKEVCILAEQRTDTLTELEERYAGYKVYDRDGEKIGKVEYLFVDENDQPEYIGVKMGLLGTKSALVPMNIVREDEDHRIIEVTETKDKVKGGPAFDDEEEITPEYEERVRSHYGLGSLKDSGGRGAYRAYHGGYSNAGLSAHAVRGSHAGEKERDRKRFGETDPGVSMRDTEAEEFHEHARGHEGLRQRSSDLREDEDELRVQRSEEELVAGTREREIGGVRLRKRVRTDREQLRVPKRREEVHIDRVPVNREASEADIGEDEVFMPILEEEVIVEKRPVAKEEIRLRKEVVEDEEVVERDVRKEEVDIDDETERRAVLEHGPDLDNERRRRSA
jgi:uncharacterized protein (TIGR02271 family)